MYHVPGLFCCATAHHKLNHTCVSPAVKKGSQKQSTFRAKNITIHAFKQLKHEVNRIGPTANEADQGALFLATLLPLRPFSSINKRHFFMPWSLESRSDKYHATDRIDFKMYNYLE